MRVDMWSASPIGPTVGGLKPGDTFFQGGDYWIKGNDDDEDGQPFCLRLRDGHLSGMPHNTEVVVVAMKSVADRGDK